MTNPWAVDRPPAPTTGDEMRTLWTKLVALDFGYAQAYPRRGDLWHAMAEGMPTILNQLEEAQALVERLRRGSQEMLAEQERLEEDAYRRGLEASEAEYQRGYSVGWDAASDEHLDNWSIPYEPFPDD